MTKKNNAKLDSVSMRDADSVSLQSDVSGSDFAADSILSPSVRTADWLVCSQCLCNVVGWVI